MFTIKSQLVNRDQLLPGIHGLRGIAALAIVLFHLIHISEVPVPEYLIFIKRDFGYCVHLFFLLSAYSLMHTTSRTIGHINYVYVYFIKRFFRIAPLFYVLICLELGRQIYSGRVTTSLADILLNFTFTFGTVPFAGIVWGGWSVGVEMIFYAIFPVLLLSVRSLRGAFGLMLAGMLISYLTRLALHQQHLILMPTPKWDWSYFAFMPNLAFFCMGIFSFFWAQHLKQHTNQLKVIIPITLVFLAALMLFGIGKYFSSGAILIWGLTFVGLAVWQSVHPSSWAANRLFAYIGERSFSIYLIHPVVITYWKIVSPNSHHWATSLPGLLAFVISATIVGVIVLAIAELTYRFIEVPGIGFSRRLVKRLET